jgi:hypothetical protein
MPYYVMYVCFETRLSVEDVFQCATCSLPSVNWTVLLIMSLFFSLKPNCINVVGEYEPTEPSLRSEAKLFTD